MRRGCRGRRAAVRRIRLRRRRESRAARLAGHRPDRVRPGGDRRPGPRAASALRAALRLLWSAVQPRPGARFDWDAEGSGGFSVRRPGARDPRGGLRPARDLLLHPRLGGAAGGRLRAAEGERQRPGPPRRRPAGLPGDGRVVPRHGEEGGPGRAPPQRRGTSPTAACSSPPSASAATRLPRPLARPRSHAPIARALARRAGRGAGRPGAGPRRARPFKAAPIISAVDEFVAALPRRRRLRAAASGASTSTPATRRRVRRQPERRARRDRRCAPREPLGHRDRRGRRASRGRRARTTRPACARRLRRPRRPPAALVGATRRSPPPSSTRCARTPTSPSASPPPTSPAPTRRSRSGAPGARARSRPIPRRTPGRLPLGDPKPACCPASARGSGRRPSGTDARARRSSPSRTGPAARRARRRRLMAERMPRSPTARTSGRCRWKIRNMCAVHSPMPLTAESSAITSSSESSSMLLELERAVGHVLGQRAQERHLHPRQPDRGPQLLGVLGQDLAGVGGRPPKRSSRRSFITWATLAESCWPMIERTSAP